MRLLGFQMGGDPDIVGEWGGWVEILMLLGIEVGGDLEVVRV